MICIECMQEKKSGEYSIVHHSVKEEELDLFIKNPSNFKGIYCVCDACMKNETFYPSLNLIQ